MAQPKVNPEHFRYMIIDAGHPSFARRRTDANERSLEIVPDNILSVKISDDGQQALIKIPGADTAWINGNSWVKTENANKGVYNIYTWATHGDLATLLSTDTNWSNTQGGDI